jgi:hypothetical protein
MDYRAYKTLVSILKQKCPAAFPVSVRRVKMSGLDGDCSLGKKQFFIRINRDISEASAIDTLLHEWAHAIAWNHLHDSLDWQEFEKRSHDASWGVAYSEVYRVYEQCYLPTVNQVPTKCNKIRYK